MATKRKRSGSLFAAPTIDASSTPFLSSPVRLPEFFVQNKTLGPQSSPFSWKQQSSPNTSQDEGKQQLNSRTRKRYRDGRPEEAEIHASTVDKLFSAQKAHPHASPMLSQSDLQPQFQPQDTPQRSTLHSFWHLPQASQLSQHGMPATHQDAMTCDGCDRVLTPEYGMDTLDQDTACGACGKHVCNTCAVTVEMRLCLDCAMQG
ncbi:hypothetical protein M438DRAFT_397616 [Aureobasidium pullulans EXF-150]|uniref:Uncharacterized protein n=1 Tax=Aureobasidium pullulans EXF-150 TaxID=1043002 RepID=A0A074XF14_AURPU|nr:uncharacterized protein M438DRAFT_397616 [Aureobasidium pullulans EXF-150]KEQ84095.1 hypothetical protein M438DRAFT_397616 [Aureobasidium pullulans EXF-150]